MTGGICERRWDAIVIGTGIGGGTIGRRLAEKGLSVLFLEKGLAGCRTEENDLDTGSVTDPAARMRRGAWPDPVRGRIAGIERHFYAPIGAGVGGSSVFYAATLERPEPHDLDHSAERPHPTTGWPVSFSQMLPYFNAAQAVFHVRGEPDPLSAHPSPRLAVAPALSQGDAGMMARMRASGLHPYRLHSALRDLEGCRFCLGRKCPRVCKMDGRSAGVEPALATGRAALVEDCEVTELRGDAGRVTHVLARRKGETLRFTADRVILAAGALSSPRLLLASRTPYWPEGCGNGRGQVGRHLMFHLNEMFALWPRRGESFAEAAKAVGFRDLYFVEGQRFGMVQAMGLNLGKHEILHHLRMRLARSALGAVPGTPQFARLPAALAARVLGQAKVFVGLLEDMPDAENRVWPDPQRPGGILIDYRFAPELLQRRQRFRQLIRGALKGQRTLFLNYEPEPNFGHPCGSLRMGLDPASSVTDAGCRVHGIANLWVADASFMPTSMGVNPSLTIAANALRVADLMTGKR
ncbi:GMC oxidoreductase [Paracoccus siganidrum]|uniref:GMC family oxidoreductase n=1 Tax=Paracoccus siganidrum TaxID=1276757 RepID=A0A419A7E8_9RHOB|nr:GMC family oxidoreductase [Paracoccus siganidrum]RJL16423.1 GMC family oxidoreductase [Paracoccus siganidrum]RMC30175.1 glucose-methanol-choline oxidoreductase [Paracoccus siganidrum]